MTTPGIDPGTVRLVAQRLNHYATPGPVIIPYLMKFDFIIYGTERNRHHITLSRFWLKWKFLGINTVYGSTEAQLVLYLISVLASSGGPGSSVGIATELRAGRSGDRIPVGTRFSAPVQTGPEAHPASCTMGTGSFRGKVRPGRDADPSPLLVPRSKIE